ncbi:MAG: M20/M25/M40 family metallo-hydrolase [Oscillospiraceae bacterium]|nr:M20/M25/M40 family metallo-hydrolase [Oscillospiraceae bacterium]
MPVLIAVLAIIVAFAAVIIVRTLQFKPVETITPDAGEVSFDREKAIENLRSLVRCKTVSYYDSAREDDAEFEKLINLLPELYPNVYSVCTLTKLPDRALLFRWKGKNNGDPAVLMAHYDVVPVEEEMWEKPPFEGIIEDGVLWGRGTLDTKATFNGILTAADKKISEGFVPENDIYMAFSGGEEVNGHGAEHIVDWFAEHNITPSLVLDEGGAVVSDVFPGVKEKIGVIGIAEKGMLNVSYEVKSGGGHASAPRPGQPMVLLANAVKKLDEKPFSYHLTKPVAEMFDTLGRHSSFVYRMIFANLWCFGGVLNMICRKSGGELNALVRTTQAFTQCEGSKAINVIPASASVSANLRLNPEDTMDSALSYLRSVIGDERVEVKALGGMNPSRISRTDVPGWEIVKKAVSDTWKGTIVTPYLMVQCSDSRHYGKISDRVYRFSAQDMTAGERGLIHGNNERIRLEVIGRAVEFFIRVIEQC